MKIDWRSRWRDLLGVDLRSLALFRFVLGSALSYDVLECLADARAFYADAGVLPRDAAAELMGPLRICLHLANGGTGFAVALLLIEALAAVALALGWRSRAANLVAFVLHGSLLNRNPLVLLDGDTLLTCLLFWGLFLPLNARWSLDAALAENAPPEDPRHCSAGGVGLLLQLFCVLVGAVILPGEHALGTALALTLILPAGWLWNWTTRRVDHGRHLRIYYDGECAFCRTICKLLCALLALPRTELLPAQGSVRAHTLMQAQASWVVIDGEDVAHTKWNAFVALLRQSLLFGWLTPLFALKLWERPGAAAYDALARHRALLGALVAALPPKRTIRYEPSRAAQGFAAIAAAAVVAWNAANAAVLPSAVVDALAPVLKPLRLDQRWTPLAPQAAPDEGRYVIPATFADGSELDLVTGQAIDWRKPADASRMNRRWHAYQLALLDSDAAPSRERYAQWLCRERNAGARPAHRLLHLQLTYVVEQPPGIEQRVLLRYDCP